MGNIESEQAFSESLAAKLAPADRGETPPVEDPAPAAAAEETAPEAEAPPAQERPRDPETGKFLPKDAAAEETAPAEEETAEAAEARRYADKYDSVEELEKAHIELQRKLGDEERLKERRELEARIAELERRLEEREAQPQIDPQAPVAVDRLIDDEEYEAAAIYALRNGGIDGPLFDKAMEAWYDEQPRKAGQFEARLEAAKAEARLRQELDPVKADRQRDSFQRSFDDAVATVAESRPDLNDFAPQMFAILEERPALLVALRENSQEARVQIIESLYDMAKGRATPTVAAAKAAAEADADLQARERAAAAAVTTASNNNAGSTAKGTAAFKSAFRENAQKEGFLPSE